MTAYTRSILFALIASYVTLSAAFPAFELEQRQASTPLTLGAPAGLAIIAGYSIVPVTNLPPQTPDVEYDSTTGYSEA